MVPDIEAIFMDVGNTLRIVVNDDEFQAQARQQLMNVLKAHETEVEFFGKLDARWKEYRKWSLENTSEASERELWTHFLLPDESSEKIAPLANRLTRLWRDKDGRRVPREDVKTVVIELNRRGYVLGIIANMITETEIPEWLEADGLKNYFKTIVLSSQFGRRKPHTGIFGEAVRQAGVDPAKSAYVGDNPERDVIGSRNSGFGLIILMADQNKQDLEALKRKYAPDHIIRQMSDLLDLFPPKRKTEELPK